MSSLRLYSIFHLNLAYSSISEFERPNVIKKCYWPLLQLIEETGVSIGIEITGYTLEEINRIDPSWVNTFKTYLAEGKCELIGSGYAQVIGPLVPAAVTKQNLQIGTDVYAKLLGVRPTIGYINEQTYSAGLLALYKETGCKAVVMEWNNAVRHQPDWESEWRYQVLQLKELGDVEVPVLWNNSIVFQKFQRYAHSEMEFPEYMSYLKSHVGKNPRNLMLYGNDAEIFNFRPGRHKAEPVLSQLHEWERITELYRSIENDPELEHVAPSAILTDLKKDVPSISLVTSEQPIVVKKQEKYNLSRWALTGRDSITINTECFRIYNALIDQGDSVDPNLWKDLCYAWDSDFRTHITEERFVAYRQFLKDLAARAGVTETKEEVRIPENATEHPIELHGNVFTIQTPTVVAEFNVRRGLTFEKLIFPEISKEPLLSMIPHGYFDHVPLNADFYSGNTVIDIPAKQRITDLERTSDVAVYDLTDGQILITGTVHMHVGVVKKYIYINGEKGEVRLVFEFETTQTSPARFHTGLLTFTPEAFDRSSLFYACHNGGTEQEVFSLKDAHVIECAPVSLLVSCSTILGNTTGTLLIGDKDKHVIIKTNPAQLAALPFVGFTDLHNTYFLRSAFSLAEFDDTTALRNETPLPQFSFEMVISAAHTTFKV